MGSPAFKALEMQHVLQSKESHSCKQLEQNQDHCKRLGEKKKKNQRRLSFVVLVSKELQADL